MLPLQELFEELRRAGLPLGVDSYALLVRALRGGFGVGDRTALLRLCCTLWATSPDDARLIAFHFGRLIDMPPEIAPSTTTQSPPANPVLPPSLPTESSAPPTTSVEHDSRTTEQVAEALARTPGYGAPQLSLLPAERLFPLSRRQMKQSWRYLRRAVREGPPVELDVEATVAQVAQQGMLLEPVLVPRRRNRAELLLLLDRGGSMVPFHAVGAALADTAQRGGRLGRITVRYMHNCPADKVFLDPAQRHAEPLDVLLGQLSERTDVLVFSDAGAARGGLSRERALATVSFLAALAGRTRRIAWLNPMPQGRWPGTTADVLGHLVPMFPLGRAGLDDALAVLRRG